MGARMKRLTVFCLCACFFAVVLMTGKAYGSSEVAGSGEVQKGMGIEQVYVNMPFVYVYGSGYDLANRDVKAYLGDTGLEMVNTQPFEESGEGLYYYVLLDVSNSMPESYFSRLKEGIISFAGGMSEKDRMFLYTFGEDVGMVLDGKQSPEQIQEAVSGLQNKDNRTLLFEAVDQVAVEADKIGPEECRRRVLLVISDGEDIATGKKMAEESLATLKLKGIPAYALCIQDTARENINSFGEFARMSGGDLTIFTQEEAGDVLSGLKKRLDSFQETVWKTGSNLAGGREEIFSMKFEDSNETVTKAVTVSRWIKDMEAPKIVSGKKISDNQIELGFSEPVAGSDMFSNYVVKLGDKVLDVSGVQYSKDQANSVILAFAGKLEGGEYDISCVNITDVSMEKNQVAGSIKISMEGEGGFQRFLRFLREWGWITILIAAAVAAAAVIWVYRRIRKNRGILYVDGKPVMASEVDVRHHVAIEKSVTHPFTLSVSVAGRYPETMELGIDGSFIVGRSQVCDLSIEDTQMSRQHFVLEWENSSMFLSDLDTTNGTSVNGIRTGKHRRLENGDKITAGTVEMIIRW